MVDAKVLLTFKDQIKSQWLYFSYVFNLSNYNENTVKKMIEIDVLNNYEVKSVLQINIVKYELKYKNITNIKMKRVSLQYKFFHRVVPFIEEFVPVTSPLRPR